MEIMLQLLIIAVFIGIVVLIAVLVNRSSSPKTPPSYTAAYPVSAPSAPAERRPVKNKEPEVPVVTIYEEPYRREMRRCPNCDGENDQRAVLCRICGRKI